MGKGGNGAYDTGGKHTKDSGTDDQDNKAYGERLEESNDHISQSSKEQAGEAWKNIGT